MIYVCVWLANCSDSITEMVMIMAMMMIMMKIIRRKERDDRSL